MITSKLSVFNACSMPVQCLFNACSMPRNAGTLQCRTDVINVSCTHNSKTFVQPLDHVRAAQIKPAPQSDLRVGHRERIQHMLRV